jgi:RNA polymerase sigma-70 factor (ECF subfamily)
MAAGPLAADAAAQLFADFHKELESVVRNAVRTSDSNVEDACADAWAILVRRRPENSETVRGWLVVVAIREAVRRHKQDRHLVAICDPHEDHGVSIERLPALQAAADDGRVGREVRDALETIAALPERQRRIFGLHVAGFSYAEIADMVDATPRTVDRQMRRACRTVRWTRPAPRR